MKQWSEKLVELTRRELEDMLTYTDPSGSVHWLIGSMDLPHGAHFKNIDGKRFGIMNPKDALAGNYAIQIKSGGSEQYDSVDALIQAGWALD
jgi:hypothetical protein